MPMPPIVEIIFSSKEHTKQFISELVDEDTPMFSCSYNCVLIEWAIKHYRDIERMALNIDASAKIKRIWKR